VTDKKLKFEITAPNIEQLEDLVELFRAMLADIRAAGEKEKAQSYIDRFIKIMGFE